MSAIAGVLRRGGAPADPADAARLEAAVARWGADGHGAVVSAGCVLATARTVATAHPPPARPATLDGRHWVVLAGRLDARDDLRRALRAAGHPPAPDADDAALVLHAVAAWGDGAPRHLLGDFALAAWDAPRRRLLLARDALGVKPLYLAETAEALVFSTSYEVVRAYPGVDGRWDEGYAADHLLFGGPMDRASTPVRGVRRLPAGHLLTAEGDAVRVARWWAPEPEPARPVRSVPEAMEAFRAVLRDAVADRVAGVDDVAVWMSGGMDSPAVAAAATALPAPPRLSAHTMAWDPLLPSRERTMAAAAAGALGIAHHVVEAAGVPMFARWDDPALALPLPIDNPLLAVDRALAASAAARARVVLTGNGGDVALVESVARLARLLRGGRLLAALGEAAAFARWHGRLPRPGFRTLRRLESPAAAPPLPAWLDPDFARRTDAGERWAAAHRPEAPAHPRRPEAWERLHRPGWQSAFEDLDPAATGLPLDVRHPLFDLRVVDFCLAVPPAAWYNDKALLRLGARGRLPRAVLRRRKEPLPGDPFEARFRRDGRNWLGGRELGDALHGMVVRSAVPRWAGGLADGPFERPWLHLRPLTLAGWLHRSTLRPEPPP